MNVRTALAFTAPLLVAAACAKPSTPEAPDVVAARHERVMAADGMQFVALNHTVVLEPIDPAVMEDVKNLGSIPLEWGEMDFAGGELTFAPIRVYLESDKVDGHVNDPTGICADFTVPDGTTYVAGGLPGESNQPIDFYFRAVKGVPIAKLCFPDDYGEAPEFVIVAATNQSR